MKKLKQCSYSWMRFSLARFSNVHLKLLIEWKNIVGEALSAQTHLMRVSFPPGKRREGRLFIEASSAHVATLNYCVETFLDRVNAFYGYPAFCAVSFMQKPARFLPKPKRAIPPIIEIADESLKKALENLARCEFLT